MGSLHKQPPGRVGPDSSTSSTVHSLGLWVGLWLGPGATELTQSGSEASGAHRLVETALQYPQTCSAGLKCSLVTRTGGDSDEEQC